MIDANNGTIKKVCQHSGGSGSERIIIDLKKKETPAGQEIRLGDISTQGAQVNYNTTTSDIRVKKI